jgi:hypothetical protein
LSIIKGGIEIPRNVGNCNYFDTTRYSDDYIEYGRPWKPQASTDLLFQTINRKFTKFSPQWRFKSRSSAWRHFTLKMEAAWTSGKLKFYTTLHCFTIQKTWHKTLLSYHNTSLHKNAEDLNLEKRKYLGPLGLLCGSERHRTEQEQRRLFITKFIVTRPERIVLIRNKRERWHRANALFGWNYREIKLASRHVQYFLNWVDMSYTVEK